MLASSGKGVPTKPLRVLRLLFNAPHNMSVLNARNGQVSDGLRCWDYCMAQGSHILTNSWGAASHVLAMDTAIAAVTNAGGLVICSAGNDGVSQDVTPQYPSGYAQTNKQVVSVAASDASGNLWLRSNYGVKGGVTLAAPGVTLLGLGLAGTYIRDTGKPLLFDLFIACSLLDAHRRFSILLSSLIRLM